jgi:hypothetical protein
LLGWWNGRHVRLRGVCRKACGFKSRPEHQKNLLTQAAPEKPVARIRLASQKINESSIPSVSDPVSMPRQQKRTARPANGSAAKTGDGSTICALCGRTIKAGSGSGEQSVIYSICVSCKRLPHRNLGSTASLC